MSSEPTEMAGVAEAETQAAYAWALDDGDDLPTQRLTPRRITSLALASSLTVIAAAGAVVLFMARDTNQPETVSAPMVVTPAAVLDGTYRFDFNSTDDTIMGAPNPPPDGQPKPLDTVWRAFRSTCTPAGCTATETTLDDTNHQIAMTPLATHQWRFIDGRWEMLPVRWRETQQECKVVNHQSVVRLVAQAK